MPKISVIVPFRNASAYLPRCLASLKQEGDFEVVLVNDRSTDDWKCVTDSFGFHVENNMSVPEGWDFCSTDDGSFANGKVGEFIRSMFPDKSRWEE